MIPEDIEAMADWLGRDDPKIQRLLRCAALDPQAVEAVRGIFRRRCRQAGIDPDDPPIFEPVHRLPPGQVTLGQAFRGPHAGPDCALPVEVCREHMGFFGHTGTGKTFLAKRTVTELALHGCTVWIMDVEDEYGGLSSSLGEKGLVTVLPDQLRLNFFQPPGSWVEVPSWLEEINLLMRGAMFLRDGSLNLFRTQMLRMLESAGVSKGGQDHPSMADVAGRFGGLAFGPNSRNRGFLDSLLNRFNMLLDAFPRTANVIRSDMLEGLAGRNVIFRLHQLKGNPLQFLVGYLLIWLMRYREGAVASGPQVVLLEEAHLQAAEKSRIDIGEFVLSRCFRMARKRGIAMILCDQIPSELPPAIVGNLGCRVVMRLANPRDVWSIQTSMGLDRDQAAALSELEKRQAVMHYSLHPRAFMIHVPQMEFPAKPSDQELLASGEKMLAQARWMEKAPACATKTAPSSSPAPEGDELVGDARSVMLDICSEPGRTIEQRCTALNLDRAREFRAREALDARGLIEQADQSLGGKVKLFQPSSKGVKWAERQGVRVKTFKSGLVHEYILHQVERAIGGLGPKWRLQRHTDVGRQQGLQPDLLVLAPEGRRLIVEVCCHNMDYEARNLETESHLAGVDAVLAITPNASVKRSLELAISKCRELDFNGASASVTIIDAGTCLADGFDWLATLRGGNSVQ